MAILLMHRKKFSVSRSCNYCVKEIHTSTRAYCFRFYSYTSMHEFWPWPSDNKSLQPAFQKSYATTALTELVETGGSSVTYPGTKQEA